VDLKRWQIKEDLPAREILQKEVDMVSNEMTDGKV